MAMRPILCCAILFTFMIAPDAATQVARPETVVVHSGHLRLRALLWRPDGPGPFPAVLFNHGSGHAAGRSANGPDHRSPELLGAVFARHGYVFLYLYRRGDGLSRGQGVPAGDRMDNAFAAGGQPARNRVQLQALEDETGDALAGLEYLRVLPGVDATRIAAIGHSFGGSVTVLAAERDSAVRAIVTFAAVGYSWDNSPELRARLRAAVDRMAAPAFFLHAANDFTTGSGRELAAELQARGKPHLLKIYPAVGTTPEEGHDFVHTKIAMWEPDVFAFLDRYLRR